MTVRYRSAPEPGPGPVRRALARLPDGLAGFLLVATLLAVAGAADAGLRGWIRTALERAWFSSAHALLALAVFVLLLWALERALFLLYRGAGRRAERVLPPMALFLLLVLGVNSLPIVVYIHWLAGLGLPAAAVTVLSLLLANAMLYYFCNRFLHMVWREVHKLYAVSATFKGDTPIGYAAEAIRWDLLNSLKPVYLYLFSFTLFTDLWLQGQRTRFDGAGEGPGMGIIGYLFQTIIHEGWLRTEVWIGLLTLWVVLWPQRALLDGLARRWERRRNLA
jgi:hypothetical protein